MILAISQSLPLASLTRVCVLRPAVPVWASPSCVGDCCPHDGREIHSRLDDRRYRHVRLKPTAPVDVSNESLRYRSQGRRPGLISCVAGELKPCAHPDVRLSALGWQAETDNWDGTAWDGQLDKHLFLSRPQPLSASIEYSYKWLTVSERTET
jgi:hypothetical protein